MRRRPLLLSCLALAVLPLAGSGCKVTHGADARQVVAIDGSSTVFPLMEAAVESFGRGRRARVALNVSGTSGGFERLCQGDVNVIGASRPILEAEARACRERGIDVIELPIAVDGITVAVHPDNDWVDALTVEELRTLWSPEGAERIRTWRDLRPSFPDREIHLYTTGGMESGTYRTFVDRVLGGGGSRSDYTSSENDQLLVEGVANDRDALGIFGFVYYAQHQQQLRAVPIAAGSEPVAPTPETIADGTYAPLSRLLFLYVSRSSADQPPVKRFVQHVLDHAPGLARQAGYVALPDEAYPLIRRRFEQRRVGSLHPSAHPGSQVLGLLERDEQRQR